MKSLLQFGSLAVLVSLLGCGDGMIKNSGVETTDAAPVAKVKIAVPNATNSKVINNEKDLIGYWVGAFREHADKGYMLNISLRSSVYDHANKINISIDAINGTEVEGHSVDAGNIRPFEGTVEHSGTTYKFLVKEPGNDQYDGVFSFSIGTGDSVLNGSWKADRQITVPVRYFALMKTSFKYNPNIDWVGGRYADTGKTKKVYYKLDDGTRDTDFEYAMSTVNFSQYNASAKLLTSSDVANLKAADLLVIRNAIYARHGYSFKKQNLRTFFDRLYWYVPVSTDVTAELTPIEKQNIALIQRYEKNAQEYYDTFGR